MCKYRKWQRPVMFFCSWLFFKNNSITHSKVFWISTCQYLTHKHQIGHHRSELNKHHKYTQSSSPTFQHLSNNTFSLVLTNFPLKWDCKVWFFFNKSTGIKRVILTFSSAFIHTFKNRLSIDFKIDKLSNIHFGYHPYLWTLKHWYFTYWSGLPWKPSVVRVNLRYNFIFFCRCWRVLFLIKIEQ